MEANTSYVVTDFSTIPESKHPLKFYQLPDQYKQTNNSRTLTRFKKELFLEQ